MGKRISLVMAALVLTACPRSTDATTTSTSTVVETTTTTTLPIVGVRSVEVGDLASEVCTGFEHEPRAVFGDLDSDGTEEAVVAVRCPDEDVAINGVFTAGRGAPRLIGSVAGNDATILGTVRPNLAVVLPVALEGDPPDEPSLVERVTYALDDDGLEVVDQRQLTPDEYLRAYAPNQPPRLTRIELLEELRTGVALVQTVACFPFSGFGTGFLVAPDLIVTNAHVVVDGILLRIDIAGVTQQGEVVGLDEVKDLALIRLPSTVNGHVFEFAAEPARLGTAVTALGFPLDPRFSATGGEVSGVGRRVVIGETFYENAIQTSAAINPGNSGGPLVDEDGRVVGVVSAAAFAENVGFVIPADTVTRVVQTWRDAPVPVPSVEAGGCDTGTVEIDTDVIDIDLPPVLFSIDQYVSGINYGEPRRAWDVNAGSVEGDAGYESFRDGVSTSFLDPFRIEGLQRTSPETVEVEVRFTSYQAPEFGRDGQTCTNWHQLYLLRVYEDGVWRIEDSIPLVEPVACDTLEEEAVG